VLVVDLDPQGGSGVSIGVATDSLNKTVYNVLINDEVGFPDIIMKTKFGFDLAPSNIDLAGAEIELKQLLASEQILKRKLEEVLDDYDYVLLEIAPKLGYADHQCLNCCQRSADSDGDGATGASGAGYVVTNRWQNPDDHQSGAPIPGHAPNKV
jgi:chromosome partitioning protein